MNYGNMLAQMAVQQALDQQQQQYLVAMEQERFAMQQQQEMMHHYLTAQMNNQQQQVHARALTPPLKMLCCDYFGMPAALFA